MKKLPKEEMLWGISIWSPFWPRLVVGLYVVSLLFWVAAIVVGEFPK